MSYKVQKPCRICGKMYTPCADCEGDKNAFHWRTVACSLKCAMEYFEKIEESRKLKSNDIEVSVVESVVEAENEERVEAVHSDITVTDNNKLLRTTRKKKNNEESE